MKNIQHRIKRIIGQLESAEQAIGQETSCNQMIPQLLAIKGAVDSAVTAYIEHSLEECDESNNPDQAKQLIKMLVKNI